MSAAFTAIEKRDSAIREANMRRRVYPRWVADGKMRQSAADREIAIMEAMADDYKKLAESDERQQVRDLFAATERDVVK